MTTLATSSERKALRFFWYWLIAATATSIVGNVAYALLASAHAPAGSTSNPIVAGSLAVVIGNFRYQFSPNSDVRILGTTEGRRPISSGSTQAHE